MQCALGYALGCEMGYTLGYATGYPAGHVAGQATGHPAEPALLLWHQGSSMCRDAPGTGSGSRPAGSAALCRDVHCVIFGVLFYYY